MKKAQSGVIVAVLLILVVIAAIVIISVVVVNLVKKSESEAVKATDCLRNIDFTVVSACYNLTTTVPADIWEIRLLIKNNKDIDFNQTFFLHITNNSGTSKDPVSYKFIEGLSQKLLTANSLNNPENADEFLLIPKLESGDKVYECYQRAVEFSVKEC
jgi:hypothetical protein